MQFESDAARNLFEAAVVDAKANQDSSHPQVVAVPLLFWYSRSDVLSDVAVYNDQVLMCDANGDGFITNQEASAFRAAAQTKAVELAAKDEDHSRTLPQNLSMGSKSPADLASPPGLIRRNRQEAESPVLTSQNSPMASGSMQ